MKEFQWGRIKERVVTKLITFPLDILTVIIGALIVAKILL